MLGFSGDEARSSGRRANIRMADELLLYCYGRARRIQNLRRETQTNRMIDITLLALEIGKSFLPQLIG